MELNCKEITTGDGNEAIAWDISTRKGNASGLFHDKRIWVHHIAGEGSVKGLITPLINRFKTNKITFTPLINDNVKNSVRGEVKICKSDSPDNPYDEDFEYMDCIWT